VVKWVFWVATLPLVLAVMALVGVLLIVFWCVDAAGVPLRNGKIDRKLGGYMFAFRDWYAKRVP
jgi:hypothetical protein